ncbi:MAG: hypothetical protein ACTMKU_02915, partial [Actinomycetaceae bacterium]
GAAEGSEDELLGHDFCFFHEMGTGDRILGRSGRRGLVLAGVALRGHDHRLGVLSCPEHPSVGGTFPRDLFDREVSEIVVRGGAGAHGCSFLS